MSPWGGCPLSATASIATTSASSKVTSRSATCSSRCLVSRTPMITQPPSSPSLYNTHADATLAIVVPCRSATRRSSLSSSWKSPQSPHRFNAEEYMRMLTVVPLPDWGRPGAPRKRSERRPPATVPKHASRMPFSFAYCTIPFSGRRSSRLYCTWFATIGTPASTSVIRCGVSKLQAATSPTRPSLRSATKCAAAAEKDSSA
mmetsp:Transcript_101200/g.290376  ORF Transcript_101200/g.290376 Transcript_101200/m.290376 type:complete len:202 (-) Transcript_101200:91-696(-)